MASDARPAGAAEPTALRRHVAFFDRDGDGRVTIGETLETLRMLGCGAAYARANAIGGMLARTSEDRLLASDVVIANAHRGTFRHADLEGETGIFDREGRFDEARFNAVLARYARSGVDGLTESDMTAMVEDISRQGTVGRSSCLLAFRLLMTVAGERSPTGELMLTRRRLRAFYQGELLPQLAVERRNGRAAESNPEPTASTFGHIAVGAARSLCPSRNGRSGK